MARVSMRDLLRFRTSFLSHHTSLMTFKPNLSSTSTTFSYSSSSSTSYFTSHARTPTLYHQTLNLLKTCQSMPHLFQIQAQLIISGLFQNPSLSGRVLKLSTDFCDIDYTILIFRCIGSPDTFCVNTVIKAYACSSVPENAVVFYFEMLKNGIFPNSFSFPPLLSSCAKMGCLKPGQKCHGQAVKNGVNSVLPVQNSLIHLYGCCGLMDVARQVFVEMPERDMVSWNSIVDGYAKLGNLSLAHHLFDAMPERNVISWNIMITGYLNGENPGWGLKLFRNMVKMGLRGTDTTMVSVLTACGRSARLKEGRSIHGCLLRTFLSLSMIINVGLIDMYSKCGRPDIAILVFDKMPFRNLVCWNAMILGHCIHGNPEDGINLYAEMVSKSGSEEGEINTHGNIKPNEVVVIPDEITFVGLLCACGREGRLTEGRNYFSQMIHLYGIKPNFAHYWCMTNLLARVGLMQEAVEILRSLPVEEDKSSESSLWAELFGLCRFQGDVIVSERIAKALIESDPQKAFYYSLLLNVYAMAGRWEDVARIKGTMKERGIRKRLGSSLVDLKEIVHNIEVGDKWKEGIQNVSMTTGELNV